MTQPPDDRIPPPSEPVEPTPAEEPADQASRPPDQAVPEEGTAAPDAPTVAWTPPDAEGQPPGVPPPLEPAPPPPSPIISADTSPPPPAPGWEVPGSPPPVTTPAPGGGWEVPTATARAAQQEGYVVGGAGARFVAWLIDGLLASLIPGAVFLLFVDWAGFFRAIFDQIQFDASGRVIQNSYTITFPITTDVVLAYLILIGVQFLYFVGFWTSRWQATPGMIGLKMRVVDANTGAPLTLVQAVKRWFAMGWWLSVFFLVPVLQNAASLAQFGVNVFLFFSIVTDDRRRGFHDKFAGSQMIRSVTSGSGATVVGCLVYIVMAILISVIAWLLLLPALLPELQQIIQDYPRNSI